MTEDFDFSDDNITLIPLTRIDAEQYDDPDLSKTIPMASWIIDHGLLEPLGVRAEGARYRLLGGRRRLAAIRYLIDHDTYVFCSLDRKPVLASEAFGQGIPCYVVG